MFAMLLTRGRWRSLASLHVYLVEVDAELAQYFRLFLSKHGIKLGPELADDQSDDEGGAAARAGPSDIARSR